MAGNEFSGSVAGGMMEGQLDLNAIQVGRIKTQQEGIQLQRDKIALAQDMRMLSLMQNLQFHPSMGGQGQPSTPDDMAGLMTQLSTIAMQSGKVDEAEKLATAASRISENSSKIDYRQFRMQQDRFTKFANYLGSAPDTPAGYATALQSFMADDPRAAADPKFQKLAQTPWQPGLVKGLQAQVLSQKDAAEIAYRKQAGDHAQAAKLVDDQRVELIKAQTQLAKDRDIHLKKAGAVTVKESELRAVTDQATRDFPTADPADIRVRSRAVAEEMIRMVRQQNLTISEASTRAYEAARSSGVYSGLRTVPVRPGTKPGSAMALPGKSSQKPEERAALMQDNMWYSVGGRPMLKLGDNLYSEEELAGMDDDEKEALGLDTTDDDENPDDRTPAR